QIRLCSGALIGGGELVRQKSRSRSQNILRGLRHGRPLLQETVDLLLQRVPGGEVLLELDQGFLARIQRGGRRGGRLPCSETVKEARRFLQGIGQKDLLRRFRHFRLLQNWGLGQQLAQVFLENDVSGLRGFAHLVGQS